MARIKPQTLLLQSKKKRGPNRVSVTTIVLCNLIVALVIYSLVATYRHWSKGSMGQMTDGLSTFEDVDSFLDSKKYDLPGYAVLNTSKGHITVELYKEGSPETVDRFLDLCKKGHFKGMPFNYVIKHHVIQGGDPQGLDAAEYWISKGKRHEQLATRIPYLNDKLVVFGRVIRGEDVVQEIEEVDTDEHYRDYKRHSQT